MSGVLKDEIMAHDVFISYAAENKAVADAVCAKLEARQIRCWIAPRDVLPGTPYAVAILEGIQGSRVFVLVFSADANRSDHVMREVEAAVDHGIAVLPFRIEDIEPSKQLHYFIKSIHWLNALTPPLERYISELAEKVQVHLAQHPSAGESNRPAVASSGEHTATTYPAVRSRRPWIVLGAVAGLLLVGLAIALSLGRDSLFSPANPVVKNPDVTPPPAPARSRSRLSAVNGYQHIVADLKRRDPELRPRLRYLTLLHRYNEPACTDADLEADRRAVRDLVAILGRGNSAPVVFLDPEQLIFRINLDDLDWEPQTDWHKVVSQYCYGLGAEGSEPLAKLRKEVEQSTLDAIPVVRADWFVVALSRPPLAGPSGLFHTPSGGLPESVGALGRQYLAQTLDLAGCARELDLADEKKLEALIRGHEYLQEQFGLAPLLKGERIRREWWESDRNLRSPYQELAGLLKIGNPVRFQ